MKPVASILALVLAMTPALAFAGSKDKPYHGKHSVHAGQAHTVSRARAQPVSHKTVAKDAKADAKPGAKPGAKADATADATADKAEAKRDPKASKDIVPAHHKTAKPAAPSRPAPARADAGKEAEPKKQDAKDLIPAVAMAPARDTRADAGGKKKHPPHRSHRTKK